MYCVLKSLPHLRRNHWHKYIWSAFSTSKSVIKDGRSMRVFAHEVNCWPVLLCIFLYVRRASDVQTTLISVRIRLPLGFSAFNWQRKLQGKKHTSRQSRSIYVNERNRRESDFLRNTFTYKIRTLREAISVSLPSNILQLHLAILQILRCFFEKTKGCFPVTCFSYARVRT